MNILFSTTADLSVCGPERNHICEVANNLAKLGHSVHLTGLAQGDLELHPNVRFYRMIPSSTTKGLFLLTTAIQEIATRKLIRGIIKDAQIDVIYQRQGRDLALDEGLALGIPVVLEVNSILAEEAKHRGLPPAAIQKSEEATLKKFHRASKLLAISDEISEYYSSLGVPRSRFAVIPVGVNIERFRPQNRDQSRLELGLGNHPLVCHVGTFRPYQGLEHAIKAMRLVLEELPNCRMLIVGYEGEHPELKFHPSLGELQELARTEGIAHSIIFTGKVHDEEVVKYLNASDVCITLRLLRCGPNTLKLWEYLACGKPVVGSRLAGMEESLHRNMCGIAVDPLNLREVAEATVKLMRDEKLRREMGERGRRLVEENYSWETIAKRIEAVLEAATGQTVGTGST